MSDQPLMSSPTQVKEAGSVDMGLHKHVAMKAFLPLGTHQLMTSPDPGSFPSSAPWFNTQPELTFPRHPPLLLAPGLTVEDRQVG